jgi:diguanylate cyclase (GGDEF)-like protein/PAS domain S-box-containing protein
VLNTGSDIDSHDRIAPKRFRFFLVVLLAVLLTAIWGCEMWGAEIVRRCMDAGRQCADQRSEIVDWLIRVASILSLCALILVGYLFHWYSRYESSATELSNQLRAVGAHLIVSESDPDGTITHVNQAFIDTSGYSREEIIGNNHRMFSSGLYPKDFYRNLWMTVSAGQIWRGTFKNLTKDGSTYWLQATIVPFRDVWGRISRYVALYSDITEAIASAESAERDRRRRENLARINEELTSDVNTDKLTGLPNRRAFAAFADRMLKVEREGVRPVSVLMIDLDFFKLINDCYGREAGDCVLVELSRRWEKHVRSSDMLARIGGDEFCVLLNDATSDQAMIVAEKLRVAAAEHPVIYQCPPAGRQEIKVSVSIGIATSTTVSGVLLDEILQLADAALYEAKNTGRDHVVARNLN